ncbi:hypothetical protein [Phycicoccus sp. CSK15P-2]|uniref:hypothetical protein n=1 Tax=Phycicoccus sp. CSK15P-2 TaxID=2807627 RepID=UPI001EF1DF67|nr:hypothetical protein [Phycicoccus sp. CSK15P-2]
MTFAEVFFAVFVALFTGAAFFVVEVFWTGVFFTVELFSAAGDFFAGADFFAADDFFAGADFFAADDFFAGADFFAADDFFAGTDLFVVEAFSADVLFAGADSFEAEDVVAPDDAVAADVEAPEVAGVELVEAPRPRPTALRALLAARDVVFLAASIARFTTISSNPFPGRPGLSDPAGAWRIRVLPVVPQRGSRADRAWTPTTRGPGWCPDPSSCGAQPWCSCCFAASSAASPSESGLRSASWCWM